MLNKLLHTDLLQKNKKRFSKLYADRKGIAITEAVIVLPVFLLIWMGLITMHHMYEKRLEAQVVSLGTAVRVSLNGCAGYTVTEDSPVHDDPDGRIPDEISAGNLSATKDSNQSWWEQVSGDQPFAWRHTTGGATKTAYNIPKLFGGPTRKLGADQYLLCNMREQDGLWDMLVNMIQAAFE